MKFVVILIFTLLLSATLGYAQSVVINKLYNSGAAGSGTDAPEGHGDVVELLVIEDRLDMRNMVLKEFSGTSSGTAYSEGGAIRFKDIPFWHSVRAGTVIVLRRWPVDYTAYVQDVDPSDRVLDLRIGDTDFFSYDNSGGPFNITNYGMVMIKTGDVAGVENAIHSFAFGLTGTGNVTYDSVMGYKMRTTLKAPTGTGNTFFLYPQNNTISVFDFRRVDQINSSEDTGIPLVWGAGSGSNNTAFIHNLRNLDHLYVHKSGDEEIADDRVFSGNVSIGASDNKGYRLAVAGSMVAEEIKVKLYGNWPDYVFHQGYELQSLEELEHYVKVQGHLPGVPSASEVEKTGHVSIGEMSKILLRKIEELTLHLIDHQKKINKLLEKKK